ncbi:hypothetical protein QOT17_015581 [Balamuthia mandrillaris]
MLIIDLQVTEWLHTSIIVLTPPDSPWNSPLTIVEMRSLEISVGKITNTFHSIMSFLYSLEYTSCLVTNSFILEVGFNQQQYLGGPHHWLYLCGSLRSIIGLQ